MMLTHTKTTKAAAAIATALMCMTSTGTAIAYLTPEEVLFHEDLYVPPSPRDVDARVEAQRQRSEARRNAEQADLDPAPEPVEEPMEEEPTHGAAPDEEDDVSDELNRELLQTIRILNRINQDQEQFYIGGDEPTHGGAPLAPTGAGTVLAVLATLGAVFVTYRRAVRASKLA